MIRRITRVFLRWRGAGNSRAGGSKTSIVFGLKNEAGSALQSPVGFCAAEHRSDKIESRPIRGTPWEYLFYLDLQSRHPQPGMPSMRCGIFANWPPTLKSWVPIRSF